MKYRQKKIFFNLNSKQNKTKQCKAKNKKIQRRKQDIEEYGNENMEKKYFDKKKNRYHKVKKLNKR